MHLEACLGASYLMRLFVQAANAACVLLGAVCGDRLCGMALCCQGTSLRGVQQNPVLVLLLCSLMLAIG
jgi:hypothetical protein